MRQQSSILAAAVVAAAIAGAATASAQARPDPRAKPAPPALAPELSVKPYSGLFHQQRFEASAALRSKMQSIRPISARRFICHGTVVVSPDSTIDPKFERAPADKKTRFSMMRVVPSGSCR
jgi:hypothetical protein